jgi:hypothetical protein
MPVTSESITSGALSASVRPLKAAKPYVASLSCALARSVPASLALARHLLSRNVPGSGSGNAFCCCRQLASGGPPCAREHHPGHCSFSSGSTGNSANAHDRLIDEWHSVRGIQRGTLPSPRSQVPPTKGPPLARRLKTDPGGGGPLIFGVIGGRVPAAAAGLDAGSSLPCTEPHRRNRMSSGERSECTSRG